MNISTMPEVQALLANGDAGKKAIRPDFNKSTRRHALRNSLQRFRRRGIFKMHEKKGFRQVLERPEGVLGFSKTNFYFEQGKVAQELGNGHAIQFFWKKWRTIRNTIFYNAFLNWKEGIIEINGSNIPV